MGRGFPQAHFFYFRSRRPRNLRDFCRGQLCAGPSGRQLEERLFQAPVAHGLHVDISPDPFLHRSEECWISVDRRTARCRPINYSLRDSSPRLGICGHYVCLAFLMGEKI